MRSDAMVAQTIPILVIAALEFFVAGTFVMERNWSMFGLWTFFGCGMLCLAFAGTK